MKIVVSYISSRYETKKTIDLINETNADGIHVDLMDGVYVSNNNFDILSLPELFKDNNKPLDIHLMVDKPEIYLDKLFLLKPSIIYIHPSTTKDIISLFKKLEEHNVKKGIVINPDETIRDYVKYLSYVDLVLLMSVKPGMGGQEFIINTKEKLKELLSYKNNNNFEVFIDGGVNSDTIKYCTLADGVVSGSYICNSLNYQAQLNKLIIKL